MNTLPFEYITSLLVMTSAFVFIAMTLIGLAQLAFFAGRRLLGLGAALIGAAGWATAVWVAPTFITLSGLVVVLPATALATWIVFPMVWNETTFMAENEGRRVHGLPQDEQ